MGLFSDEHTVAIGPSTVQVTAKTGLVHATLTLLVDGEAVDEATAAGDFRLRGQLADGSPVVAAVFQSLMGPTRVTVEHAGTEIAAFTGFVA